MTISRERASELNEVAFYYPGHLWHVGHWVKTLLLFFDGVGLLIPEYKKDEPELTDPVLAGPLRERGLLHYLVADEVVDGKAADAMLNPILDLVSSGVFNRLAEDESSVFHSISMSRMGFHGHEQLAEELHQKLTSMGLARPSDDGVSIPVHPQIRYLMLVLLAQILRAKGTELGMQLCPATDRPQIVDALSELLDTRSNTSPAAVVSLDLQTVSADLSAVPLDEVLSFKKAHGKEYQAYARSVRGFSRELSTLPQNEREAALLDRQAELDDLASDLKRASRVAWKRPATFALGLAGASWTYYTGDLIGALLGAGAVAVGEGSPNDRSAFSYLFRARRQFDYS